MASGISGNFNFPNQPKNYGINTVPAAASEKLPDDSVQLTGTGFAAPMVAGLAAQMACANPDLSPAEIKSLLTSTSTEGVVNPEAALKAALNRSPVHLSMDETSGVGLIQDSLKADNGHGLTGLNTISSVVSTGRFEGLNGSYGENRLFGI
jgi:subtilisin family serine protease